MGLDGVSLAETPIQSLGAKIEKGEKELERAKKFTRIIGIALAVFGMLAILGPIAGVSPFCVIPTEVSGIGTFTAVSGSIMGLGFWKITKRNLKEDKEELENLKSRRATI